MATDIEVKNAMFKLKKILYSNGEETVERVGIVMPYFDNYEKKYSPYFFVLMGLDGTTTTIRGVESEIKTTRVMDSSERGIVDKLITLAKQVDTLRREEIKIHAEVKKKTEQIHAKLDKSKEAMDKQIYALKRKQGYLTEANVIEYLSKVTGQSFYKDYKDYYVCDIGNFKVGLSVDGNTIESLKVGKEVDLGKWHREGSFDFLYEEYDGSLHVNNIRNSSDFEKLKRKYFSPIDKKVLSSLKAKESFNAYVGDKNSVGVYHELYISYGVAMNKDNVKKVSKALATLLKSVK